MGFDILTIYIFVIGLVMGSFYNVCIYRIPREESLSFPPSHCTSCNTRLKPLDLIPVLSYLFLGRKCRYCGEKISPRYAAVELLTGFVFTALYIKYGLSLELLKFAAMASFLIVIGLIDYDTTDVYSVTTWSGIACGIIFIAIGYFTNHSAFNYPVMSYVYGGLLSGGLITVIILLTKGMGWGDVEICALGGVYLGLANSIVMLFLSFVIGAAAGILLIVTGKKTRKDYIPFGPYIAIGAVVAALVGDVIVKWYTF